MCTEKVASSTPNQKTPPTGSGTRAPHVSTSLRTETRVQYDNICILLLDVASLFGVVAYTYK
eukprot:3442508-Rhodomonas_salina.5